MSACARSTGAGSPPADTPDGPSLGLGLEPREAIERALKPFEGIVDELLASVPRTGLG
jgi:hypothetical protein